MESAVVSAGGRTILSRQKWPVATTFDVENLGEIGSRFEAPSAANRNSCEVGQRSQVHAPLQLRTVERGDFHDSLLLRKNEFWYGLLHWVVDATSWFTAFELVCSPIRR